MKHRLALIFGLTALTALLFAADLTAGSSGMPLSAVLNALLAGPSGQSPEALILWSLRLPMTLTALFVGAALALAGLQIQTITANALLRALLLSASPRERALAQRSRSPQALR